MARILPDDKKLKNRTEDEIVAFACNLSEKAFAEFGKRGWLKPVPSYEEACEIAVKNEQISKKVKETES